MIKKMYSVFIGVFIFLFILFSNCQKNTSFEEGLVGIYFSEPNLTSIKAYSVLTSLEQVWGQDYEYGIESSGHWNGFIIAPAEGKIRIHVETNRKIKLSLEGSDTIVADRDHPVASTEVNMLKGEKYPVDLKFWNDTQLGVFIPSDHVPQSLDKTDAFFVIKWSWDKQPLSSIPAQYLKHSSSQAALLMHIKEPDPKSINMKQFLKVHGEHHIVFHEKGRFGGWPANNGIWSWGNEILVAFTKGYFRNKKHHHSYDQTKQGYSVTARSLDGGETWTLEEPENFNVYGKKTIPLIKKINFTHQNFALRNDRDKFIYSYDRGKTWKGPFSFPDFKKGPLTSRTDCLVSNQYTCLFFLSSKTESVKATLQDRSFCARTTDGGQTIEYLGWMTETDTIRSVMPATVRISDTHLISAMRRRYDPPITEKPILTKNWIDVYQSLDNGKTWSFLNKIAKTDTGLRNGNPPSMVRLENGRLCVIYGYRGVPYTIRARVSDDDGKTWSKEIILRDGARNWDIGYTRSVVRPDQKVVTVYYFTSDDPFENHIVATIWDPMEIDL